MTKHQAAKVEKFLRGNVDEPFICTIQDTGRGVYAFAHAVDDPIVVAKLFIAQLDNLFKMLNGTPEQNTAFKKLFVEMLTEAAKGWTPHED